MIPWNVKPPKPEPKGVADALKLMAVEAIHGGDMKLALRCLAAIQEQGNGLDVLPLYPEPIITHIRGVDGHIEPPLSEAEVAGRKDYILVDAVDMRRRKDEEIADES